MSRTLIWILSLTLLTACGNQQSGPSQDTQTAIDAPTDLGPKTDSATDEGQTTPDQGQDTATSDTSDASLDAAPQDTQASDSTQEDSATAPDAQPPQDVVPDNTGAPDAPVNASIFTIEFQSPEENVAIEVGQETTFEASVTDSLFDVTLMGVVFSSDKDGVLGTAIPNADGTVSVNAALSTAGWHIIKAQITGHPLEYQNAAFRTVGGCTWGSPDTFDTDTEGSGWNLYGDAYWDAGGWLELTGNSTSKAGHIFNTQDVVLPGDVAITFRIFTGGGINTGADGFTMSVIEVPNVSYLEDVINASGIGGGLGYGISGGWGNWTGPAGFSALSCNSISECQNGEYCNPANSLCVPLVHSFHIEFDTWQNIANGGSEWHTDPTPLNHIAVTLDGDPGNHLLWADVQLEDSQWHDISVEVDGSNVKVSFDGTTVINDVIPGMDFRGGFIGFSGSTGWATNYHRFDDLQVIQQCIVP